MKHPISAIDRVMRAYASKHALNPHQAAFVRAELSKIIDELMEDRKCAPTMHPDAASGKIQRPVPARPQASAVGTGFH